MNPRQVAKYAMNLLSATKKMRESVDLSTWVTLTPEENKAVLHALAALSGRETERRVRRQVAEDRRARRRRS